MHSVRLEHAKCTTLYLTLTVTLTRRVDNRTTPVEPTGIALLSRFLRIISVYLCRVGKPTYNGFSVAE